MHRQLHCCDRCRAIDGAQWYRIVQNRFLCDWKHVGSACASRQGCPRWFVRDWRQIILSLCYKVTPFSASTREASFRFPENGNKYLESMARPSYSKTKTLKMRNIFCSCFFLILNQKSSTGATSIGCEQGARISWLLCDVSHLCCLLPAVQQIVLRIIMRLNDNSGLILHIRKIRHSEKWLRPFFLIVCMQFTGSDQQKSSKYMCFFFTYFSFCM